MWLSRMGNRLDCFRCSTFEVFAKLTPFGELWAKCQ